MPRRLVGSLLLLLLLFVVFVPPTLSPLLQKQHGSAAASSDGSEAAVFEGEAWQTMLRALDLYTPPNSCLKLLLTTYCPSRPAHPPFLLSYAPSGPTQTHTASPPKSLPYTIARVLRGAYHSKVGKRRLCIIDSPSFPPPLSGLHPIPPPSPSPAPPLHMAAPVPGGHDPQVHADGWRRIADTARPVGADQGHAAPPRPRQLRPRQPHPGRRHYSQQG